MAKFGKVITHNNTWYRSVNGQRPNLCSALVLSSVFNTDSFVKRYEEVFESKDGISTLQENLLLSHYFNRSGEEGFEENYQLLNVFETNAKFAIPKDILIDIWSDRPESDNIYIYFLNIVGTGGGFHKCALIQDKDTFYYLDPSYQTILEYDSAAFFEHFYYNKLVNLSVLASVKDNSFKEYKAVDFSHIVNI